MAIKIDVNFQALFTAYMVLLVIFGGIAFSSLVVLFFSIPTILHPYFYADGVMLFATGIVQMTCGLSLILIDRNRCCCLNKDAINSSLKRLLFPISLILFAAMWSGLLAMPHNNVLQLKQGLEDEIRRNTTDGLMKMAHSALGCCGINDDQVCPDNYLPIDKPVLDELDNMPVNYICPKGSPFCQRGCLLSIWQSMILPYRPIEMALGLFGLLLLAVCPLTYAISRCRLYWCPTTSPQESPGQSMPYLAGGLDDDGLDTAVVTDDIVPLYPRPVTLNPVLNSLLPSNNNRHHQNQTSSNGRNNINNNNK